MIIAPLVNLASGFLDSLIPTNPPAKTTTPSSPFAQMLSSLEQLEQSSLAPYQQAAAKGSASLAAELTQLSADFTNV